MYVYFIVEIKKNLGKNATMIPQTLFNDSIHQLNSSLSISRVNGIDSALSFRANSRISNASRMMESADFYLMVQENNRDQFNFVTPVISRNRFFWKNSYYNPEKICRKASENIILNVLSPLFSDLDSNYDGISRSSAPVSKAVNLERIRNRISWNEETTVDNYSSIPIVYESRNENNSFDSSHYADFVPGFIMDLDSLNISQNIIIEISWIEFLVHPLSSSHDIIRNKFYHLFYQYQEIFALSIETHLELQISELRKQLCESPNDVSLLKRIIETISLKDSEEYKIRKLRDSLQEIWNELKDLQANSFISTPHALKWLSKKRSEDRLIYLRNRYEEEINKQANEICLYKEQTERKIYDPQEIIQGIRNRHHEMGICEPNEADWQPMLKHVGTTPVENLPLYETSRRKRIQQIRLFLIIRIGKAFTITQHFSLSEFFKLYPSIGVKFEVVQIPKYVTVEIWQEENSKQIIIGKASIPICNGIPSDFNITQFSSKEMSDEGKVIVGELSHKCYIEPRSVNQIVREAFNRKYDRIKRNLMNNPISFISISTMVNSYDIFDPNNPKVIQSLNGIKTDFSTRNHSKCRLDENTKELLLCSMAPMHIDSFQIPVKSLRTAKCNLDDVVHSDYPSLFSELIISIVTFFRKRRKLLPIVSPFKHLSCFYYSLRAGLVELHGYPKRDNTRNELFSITNHQMCVLRPFIRVTYGKYQKISEISTLNIGEIKSYFEIPIDVSDKISPDLYQLLLNDIRIDLFDRVDIIDGNHTITEDHFIGGIELSVNGIINNNSIRAKIPIIIHPLILGYNLCNTGTYITSFFTFYPSLQIHPREENVVIEKTSSLYYRLNVINKVLGDRCDMYKTFFVENKKGVLCCQSIKKANPPPGFVQWQAILRFVSMISYEKINSFGGFSYRSCAEILKSMECSALEHSIVLCNMLKYIGEDSYLLIGQDKILGNTSFVLLKKEDEIYILDTTYSRFWKADDKCSTLMKVFNVINEKNIWYNLQNNELSWNFNNKDNWISFFSTDFNASMLRTSIPEELEYLPINVTLAKEIEHALFNILTASFEEMRNGRETIWDNDKIDTLQSIIMECEDATRYSIKPNYNEMIDIIRNLFPNCRLNGAPFCIAIKIQNVMGPDQTSMIIKEIFMRRLYETEQTGVIFSLALKVIPYPNDVFNIWVFLLSCCPLMNPLI